MNNYKPKGWPLLTKALVTSMGLALLSAVSACLLWGWAQHNGLAFADGLGDWQITVEGARARELTKLITLGILSAALVFFKGVYSGFRRVYQPELALENRQQMRLARLWWFALKAQRVAWIVAASLVTLACLLSVGTSRGSSWN